MAYTYILYSPTLDKYYVGATRGCLKERIRRHNTQHNGYTGRANDWELMHSEPFDSIELAMSREREIKGWKRRSAIERLIETSKGKPTA